MMNGYFNSWRRKIGIATLLGTCVFTAAWVRSLVVADVVTFVIDHIPYEIVSRVGYIECHSRKWQHKSESGWEEMLCVNGQLLWNTSADRAKNFYPLETISTKNRQHTLGFAWGKMTYDGLITENSRSGGKAIGVRVTELNSWAIQYGLIVAPLTVLSSFLLLSTPRKKLVSVTPSPVALEE